jgi:tetratricopeptide (TPR) repeat protein
MPPIESRTTPKPWCAVILTALPIEYQAVRDHITNLKEETHPKGTVYELGSFLTERGTWEIVIAIIGSGNDGAALEAERAIEYFNPSVILFVGVAGGIKDVRIGDVVAANKIYGYESGKADTTFKPRGNVGNSSYSMVQRAQAEARKEDWLKRIKGDSQDQPPKVFIGAIAAGEKVVSSTRSAIYEFIKEAYSDSLAVEMEGSGFLKAAQDNEQVKALVIRGVSDLLDGKSEADVSGSQIKAARHASAFTFEILSKLAQTEVRKNTSDETQSSKLDEILQNQSKIWDLARCISNEQVTKTGLCLKKWGITNDQLLMIAENALEIAKDSYEKGLALFMKGNFGEAELEFNNSIKIHPENPEYYFLRGNTRHVQQKIQGAFEDYSVAIQLNPKYTPAWINIAVALDNLDRYEEALEASNKALGLDHKNVLALSNKAFSLNSLGRHTEALKASNEAIGLDPKHAVIAWLNKGVSLDGLGRHKEALEAFNETIKLAPKFAQAWSNKTSVLRKLGRHKEALEALNKVVELDPKRGPDIWNNKAYLLNSLDRPKEALDASDKALLLDPIDPTTWINRGVSLGSLGRHEEALNAYNEAIKLDPMFAEAWSHKACTLGNLGRHEEALEASNKAIELDSELAIAWGVKVTALINLGRNEEVLEVSDNFFKLDPNRSPDIWLSRSYSLNRLGRYEEALKASSNAIELDSLFAKAWVNRAYSLNRLGRYEEALKASSKAIKLDPDFAEGWTNKATALYNLGRYKKALKASNNAIDLCPNLALAWAGKAAALVQLGRDEEASIAIKKALMFDSNVFNILAEKRLRDQQVS